MSDSLNRGSWWRRVSLNLFFKIPGVWKLGNILFCYVPGKSIGKGQMNIYSGGVWLPCMFGLMCHQCLLFISVTQSRAGKCLSCSGWFVFLQKTSGFGFQVLQVSALIKHASCWWLYIVFIHSIETSRKASYLLPEHWTREAQSFVSGITSRYTETTLTKTLTIFNISVHHYNSVAKIYRKAFSVPFNGITEAKLFVSFRL